MNLVTLLLVEPIVAFVPGAPETLHALTGDGVGRAKDWPDVDLTAACGVTGVKLIEASDADGWPVRWPVPARLPEGFTRCAECWNATGKQRPRSRVEAPPAPALPEEET